MPSRGIGRRRFLKQLGAAGVATAGPLPRGALRRKKPNVLFIMTDQQHAGMLSCAGNPRVKTPNLDRLAAQGVRFERAYCTNPVCVPSRFSLQTGLYPTAVGCRHNGSPVDREKTRRYAAQSLGQVFRRAGYRTFYGGKVHLPGAMNRIQACGYTLLARDRREELARSCASFLKKEGSSRNDRPFLLFVSFINPHDICYMAINDWRVKHGKEKIGNEDSRICEAMLREARARGVERFVAAHAPPLPANFEPTEGEPEAIRKLLALRPFRYYARTRWAPSLWRLHRWLYCRLTERVDRHIGRVIDALRQSGLSEETIVVFTSDHGDMDSAHRMEHKTVFYEEAARIPFIVSWKGNVKAGAVDHTHLVSNGLDLLPTLCEMTGVRAPAGLPGRSLRSLLEGSAPTKWRSELVLENQIGFMVHTGRYKYAFFGEGKKRELIIDLVRDPGEMRNVAYDSTYASIVKDLRERLFSDLTRRGVSFRPPVQ